MGPGFHDHFGRLEVGRVQLGGSRLCVPRAGDRDQQRGSGLQLVVRRHAVHHFQLSCRGTEPRCDRLDALIAFETVELPDGAPENLPTDIFEAKTKKNHG